MQLGSIIMINLWSSHLHYVLRMTISFNWDMVYENTLDYFPVDDKF